MKDILLVLISLMLGTILNAQKKEIKLPYYDIPEYDSVKYTAGAITARMIDGLGFRYRWATENLREKDLNFKVTDSSRTVLQTVDHILGLSRVIVSSALNEPMNFTKQQAKLSYKQKRLETLNNFKKASAIFLTTSNIKNFKIQFISTGGESEYPFWNQINGPISDAIWHSGQIVTLRRASGNPISTNVRFLEGKYVE